MVTQLETKTDLKSGILHYLKYGKANAITGKELARLLGERDTRTMRQVMLELLKEGNAICCSPKSPKGYYLASNVNEIMESMATLKGYCVNAAIHRGYLKRCLNELSGQQKLCLSAGVPNFGVMEYVTGGQESKNRAST